MSSDYSLLMKECKFTLLMSLVSIFQQADYLYDVFHFC